MFLAHQASNMCPPVFTETAPPPSIQLPSTIKESLEATLTCSMNTACFGYQIELRWSLEGTTVNKIELTDKTILTQSQLSFQPQWEDHGKNVTCKLWDLEKNQLLSETSKTLDVKRECLFGSQGSSQLVVNTKRFSS